MPAGVLPGTRRHTIPRTEQSAEGGRVPGVPLEGPIVAPRRQVVLHDVKVTPSTPLQDHRRKIITSTPIMATMTERPRCSRTAQPTMEQPRIRTQATPHPPGAYPPDKFSTPIQRQIGRMKTSPSQPPRYEQLQQYTNPGTPGGAPGAPDDDDPDEDKPDDQDDQEDEENFKEEEQEEQNPYDYDEVEEIIPDWKGISWKSMFDPHTLTNMQPITTKPKIPTPEIWTVDIKWSEANKFDIWAIDVLNYLMVHHIRPEDDEALPYAAGYPGGLAKEFMST